MFSQVYQVLPPPAPLTVSEAEAVELLNFVSSPSQLPLHQAVVQTPHAARCR